MTRLLAGVALALLTGCFTLGAARDCAALGAGARQCLLPPGALHALGASTRSVAFRRGAASELWIMQIEADDARTLLVVSDPLGLPRFSLRHDAGGLHVEPEAALAHADATRLLALLELAHADPAALRRSLHGAELTLGDDGGRHWRELRVGGALRARAEIEGDRVTLRVPALDLEVKVDALTKVAR